VKLRSTTIREIERILDNTYFTLDSFKIENKPNDSVFLKIKFIPVPDFVFSVKPPSSFGKNGYISSESPGIHMASPELYNREDFNAVKNSIDSWVERIKHDLDSSHNPETDIDEQIEKLRENFKEHENEKGKFSDEEASELLLKLEALEETVLAQAEKIEASENQVKEFKSELKDIKLDLSK